MYRSPKIYDEIELSTDVMTASNHRLIQLLLDKCLKHIESAKSLIEANQLEKKHQVVAKALDIVEYLRLCLNHKDETAKKLSALLDSLYAFLQMALVKANIKNDVTYLNQAINVLSNIKSGWDGIAQ